MKEDSDVKCGAISERTSKNSGLSQIQKTENFFVDMINCLTRYQKWDFLSITEYRCDTNELNEAMAAMTDDQINDWFPKICAEYFCKNISKTL